MSKLHRFEYSVSVEYGPGFTESGVVYATGVGEVKRIVLDGIKRWRLQGVTMADLHFVSIIEADRPGGVTI